MYGGIDVWREDWRRDMVWSFKMGAPCGPVRRGLVSISGSFKQILLSSYRRVLAFLPGSGSQVEFDITHSKQTSAPFLPGSRIGTRHPIRGGVSSPLFARSIQSAPRNSRTSLQTPPRFSAQIFS
jgi:hypothetical protein